MQVQIISGKLVRCRYAKYECEAAGDLTVEDRARANNDMNRGAAVLRMLHVRHDLEKDLEKKNRFHARVQATLRRHIDELDKILAREE